MVYVFRAIRVIRNFEFHLHEYNNKLHYNHFVHVVISQGYHKVVMNFLEKVPSLEKRGNRGLQSLFLIFIKFN